MITPNLATLVLAIAALILLVIIPILDGTKRFAKYISLRYTLTAVATIMALGCILDFSHLAESSRNIVLTGAMTLIGVFVAVRSIEKIKLGNKVVNLEVSKGDVRAKATIANKSDHQGRKLINESNSPTSTCSNNCISEDTEHISDQEES